jgi:hypothetical protein
LSRTRWILASVTPLYYNWGIAMPIFTFVHYDGSDERILHLVTELLRRQSGAQPSSFLAPDIGGSSLTSMWDEVARRFAKYVSAAAAAGNHSQKNAIIAWLRSGGEIELVRLWRAAGVRAQHDHSGVGGSMTKNMLKAGGPREWYTATLNSKEEWIYKIVPELVEPLKRSFGAS